jgi:D-3-phosphoglycerate dehydrogenase
VSAAPPRFRIVVSDPLDKSGLQVLAESGRFDTISVNGADPVALREALSGADALLVRSGTKVTADLLALAPRLRLVGRAGTGVDNIDVEASTARGIVVMNTPDANSIAAAEQTLALILALVRKVVPAARSLAEGRWERTKFLGTELAGKTLGVVGFGRIGREVARRARAFDMTVLVHDPFISDEMARHHEAQAVSLDDLLGRSDIVTLHAPLTAGTRHIINAAAFERMKTGARIVNCARGGLLDEAALFRALESGRLAGAALDVFETEPPAGSPLLGRPEVVLTPHLGASTLEAQENVAVELAIQVRDYFLTGAIRNAVNMPALSAEAFAQAAPYLDLAERLGFLAGTLRGGKIEKLGFEYLGEAALLPLTAITLAGLKGCLSTRGGSVNYVNARVVAAEQGIAVEESFDPAVGDFSNLMRVTVRTKEGALTVGGTVLRRNHPRLVTLDDYELDATPAGNLIVLQNDDVPGVVGAIGTLLGEAGINIARINWGRENAAGTALTVISVDEPPAPAVLESMAADPRVRWVKVVRLPV